MTDSSPAAPLTGRCLCGAVRFAVSAPFEDAGYCHCRRCQHRTGNAFSVVALAPASAFAFLQGRDAVGTWVPPEGKPKAFCATCGGHLYSGDPDGEEMLAVRMGALDADPGIRPQWHQWVESAPAWDELPDDGLPRFPRSRREGR